MTGLLVLQIVLGLLVQERLTTSTDLGEMTIKGITRQKAGGVVIHKVELSPA